MMEMYFLKSAACLAVLLLFYKLLLEKENMHVFKRFYLLASAVAAIGIPFITFTTYVETTTENIIPLMFSSGTSSGIPAQTINYWPYILLAIYLLGVLFFSIKFYRNLRRLIIKIKTNPKLITGNFINVLISEEIHPHTFFSFIFYNRKKYLLDQIPEDVRIHEEAHARQMHSLDVILVELLQIIFWFNPLIFLLKDAMKLNHEFLADREVIMKGIPASRYQKILLAYSSGDLQSDLVNPINYSSIKKRFTVMKTKTSKTSFWVRTLLLLPLMVLIIYGFSDRAVVIKEAVETTSAFTDSIPGKNLKLHIEEESIVVNGKITNLKDFANTMNEITSNWKSKDFELYGLEIKVEESVENSFIDKINAEFRKTNLAKATSSNSPYIPQSSSSNALSTDFASAPPRMEDYFNDRSNIYLEGKIISADEARELINTMGKKLIVSIHENGKNKTRVTLKFKDTFPQPPATPKIPSASEGLYYTAAQSPPSQNANRLEYVIELAKRGANFYIGPHEYSLEEVIKMVKESTNEVSIDVSKYPIVKINGC